MTIENPIKIEKLINLNITDTNIIFKSFIWEIKPNHKLLLLMFKVINNTKSNTKIISKKMCYIINKMK